MEEEKKKRQYTNGRQSKPTKTKSYVNCAEEKVMFHPYLDDIIWSWVDIARKYSILVRWTQIACAWAEHAPADCAHFPEHGFVLAQLAATIPIRNRIFDCVRNFNCCQWMRRNLISRRKTKAEISQGVGLIVGCMSKIEWRSNDPHMRIWGDILMQHWNGAHPHPKMRCFLEVLRSSCY